MEEPNQTPDLSQPTISICAWCKEKYKLPGETDWKPLTPDISLDMSTISHGICEECKNKVLSFEEKLTQALNI